MKCALSTLLPQVTAPWLASSMPSCALMYFRTASGSSAVDGVPYSAIGMLPKRRDHLREHGARERDAGDGEAGGNRRVRVHHAR